MDRQEIEALLSELASPASLSDTHSVLSVLEASAQASEETVEEIERLLRDHPIEQSVVDDIVQELVHWTVPEAEQPFDAWETWLRSVEPLGLARRGLERLHVGPDRLEELRRALVEVLERARVVVELKPERDLFAGLAEDATRRLGGEKIEPWVWLRGGELVDALQRDSNLLEPALECWVAGTLHTTDARDLRTLVEAKEYVREAYCRYIQQLARELHVTRWSPEWSLDVASSNEDIPYARRVFFMTLPHSRRRVDVRQHSAGTWWSFSDDVSKGEIVPWERDCHVWRDDLLGEVRTLIRVEIPSPEVNVSHGVESLRLVGGIERGNREDEVARSLARDLESGILGRALYLGCDKFEKGLNTTSTEDSLVAYALEVRMLLSRAASLLASAGRDITLLSAAMQRTDEAHRDHGKALHLLEDRTYERIVDGMPLDEHEWWGAKERLDRLVPPGLVEGALRRKLGEVIQFPTSRRRAVARPSIVRLAAATTPQPALYETAHSTPGHVPILLYEETTGRGFAGELWVRERKDHDVDDMWRESPQLMMYARDVIRGAFYAAGSCTPYGVPPRAFGDHRIAVRIAGGIAKDSLEIDGASLGLSAALAFASLWVKAPIQLDVAATATVRGKQLGPVYGVGAKASALAAVSNDQRFRLLCHPLNKEDAAPIGVAVETLEDALRLCDIDLSQLDESLYGSVSERNRELQNLLVDVRSHHVSRGSERATWLDLADRMRRLILSLDGQPGAISNLIECRCYAALAYTHAGDLESAATLLHSVTQVDYLPLPLRALCSIVQMSLQIDRGTAEDEAAREEFTRLEAIIADLRDHDAEGLLGVCVGTLGRALMHEYRLAEAVPLLRSAVEHHGVATLVFERARSRVYLATALRMNSQAEEALEEVHCAEKDLEEYTRPFSEEYAQSCQTYLLYEKARILVSLGHMEEALEATEMALRGYEYLWWPQLGILRVRAWALRGLLRERDADACVERMLQIKRSLAPPGQQLELIDELIAEAKGDRFDGGVVY